MMLYAPSPIQRLWRWLSILVLAVLATACGGNAKDKPASQVAAKVNKEELSVHQINFLLQQQRGLKPEQSEAASRQVLERLIDQELALQKAAELKVDRDPRVMQQIDAARRDIIARAYSERVGEGASRPNDDEITAYFDAQPALFKERRVYNLQEIAIEAKPGDVEALRAQLVAAASVPEFVESVRANGFRYTMNQAVRSAEQLPLASLDTFAKMKDGHTVLNVTPTGVQVIVLVASRNQPVGAEQAKPAIEQFLLNERRRKLMDDDIKALRANAKIEYVGSFAEAAVRRPDTAASAPASGLDIGSINSGMGLKK